jgi:hypothetical protein
MICICGGKFNVNWKYMEWIFFLHQYMKLCISTTGFLLCIFAKYIEWNCTNIENTQIGMRCILRILCANQICMYTENTIWNVKYLIKFLTKIQNILGGKSGTQMDSYGQIRINKKYHASIPLKKALSKHQVIAWHLK